MIPPNVVYPFFYIMDIVKDLVQFVLLVVAVGGLSKFLEYWSSFSSMVCIKLYPFAKLFFISLAASKKSEFTQLTFDQSIFFSDKSQLFPFLSF